MHRLTESPPHIVTKYKQLIEKNELGFSTIFVLDFVFVPVLVNDNLIIFVLVLVLVHENNTGIGRYLWMMNLYILWVL